MTKPSLLQTVKKIFHVVWERCKTRICVWVVAITLFSSFGGSVASVSARDDGFRIAVSGDIPGKFGWTTCEVFAQELYRRLTDAGGESYYIIFSWENPSGMTGRHAIVVFRDEDGDYWGMDARAAKPLRVRGDSPKAWARSYCQGYSIHVASVVTDKSLKGQYANLNRDTTSRKAGVVSDEEAKPAKRSRASSRVMKVSAHEKISVNPTKLVSANFYDGLTPRAKYNEIASFHSLNLEHEIALTSQPTWNVVVKKDSEDSLVGKKNFLKMKFLEFFGGLFNFEKEKLTHSATLWLPEEMLSQDESPDLNLSNIPQIVSLL